MRFGTIEAKSYFANAKKEVIMLKKKEIPDHIWLHDQSRGSFVINISFLFWSKRVVEQSRLQSVLLQKSLTITIIMYTG